MEHSEAPGFVEKIFALCWVTSFDEVEPLSLLRRLTNLPLKCKLHSCFGLWSCSGAMNLALPA